MIQRYEALTSYLLLPAVVGGGGTALRDFVSDAVGNATQDANYKGLYLPFYTVGTGAGETLAPARYQGTGALMFHKHMQASCQASVKSRSVHLSTASMQVMLKADADSLKLPMLAGQQAFLNNTYVYSIGDFPLSEKDYKTAFRSVKLPHL